ncbi:dihydrodipicolinate synthase family protein [Anoxynatronum buryatiense]|uniref:4-hydroxy-2-oxoglutarate aldolase n=1 Tax=Anoxynatronum buryatiense TaxID=489973 RepID=A0AA45WXY9_9CLOT|nr:dihydrodipicolinate synthase family protein [Anoxynatronum buryatiense]SMP66623.1 4-hydroxy-2-oxoglutarate aldolase [Anoxynatronum buryatiense]
MFNGIYTPVLTPFTRDETIDYEGMAHNLSRWAATDLSGIVVLGSNGEFVYLTQEEKEALAAFCISHFPRNKKVIVGTSCESTLETIRFSHRVAELGADAVLVLPPHYYTGSMNESVLYQYFTDVADACPVPVMMYNMPANTGLNLGSALVTRLSQHENIQGIKDTSGNIVQLAEIIRDAAPDFAVFAGNAGYLLPALSLGAQGATLALANILPQECCRLMDLFHAGDLEEARQLQLKMLAINHLVTRGKGVSALKTAADLLGYTGGIPRRPLMPLQNEEAALVADTLRIYGALA